jgi:hypothetical protein
VPIQTHCLDVEHKYRKGKHAGNGNHNPPRHLGGFQILPSMVCNFSETQCANYSGRRKNSLEIPQEKHQLPVANGAFYRAKAEKYLALNASADTNTRKDDHCCPAVPE